MSLYGMMRTGVSGMNAQANKLGTISDNIANANTTGYKKADEEFSTMVISGGGSGAYASGGVDSHTRYSVATNGDLVPTSSKTDLGIDGGGFFIVADANGTPFLTRAGSFLPDGNGNLVNAAGYTLLGYDATGGTPAVTANGYAGLVPVNVRQSDITAVPSTKGTFTANLPSNATAVPAADAMGNGGTSYTQKTSLVTYDNLGNQKLIDIYFTKVDTGPGTWQAVAYDHDDPTTPLAGPQAIGFDSTTGKLTAGGSMTVTVPNGQSMTIDMSGMTQLAYGFDVSAAVANGNAPSKLTDVTINGDGSVTANYENGTTKSLYQIALADVPSPDNLQPLSGNVYSTTLTSGNVQLGFPGSGSLGDIRSGVLESSNVDLGEELTNMIQAQSSYTANSKVFQTGSDLLTVLVNLQR